MDITAKVNERIEELTDKHWEESRQLALYDDELKKAMYLLKEVSNIHAAALRENSYETRILSGKLMQQVRALETEIKLSEVQK
jgi:hypothetical protein